MGIWRERDLPLSHAAGRMPGWNLNEMLSSSEWRLVFWNAAIFHAPLCRTSVNVVSPPYVPAINGFSCHSAEAVRGPHIERMAAAAYTHLNYFTTRPRNTRANGDTVTSPAVIDVGFASPSLFASRISVTLRFGSVITSDEEMAGLIPYCHTTGSPL